MTTHSLSRNSRIRGAFTIVELLVVVAILLILASLIFMGMKKAREQATAAIDANDMRTIAAAVVMYAADHNDQLPTTWAGVSPTYRRNQQGLVVALARYFGPEEPKDGTFYDEFASANWQSATRDPTGPSLLTMHNVYSGTAKKFDPARPSPKITPFGYPSGNNKREGMRLTAALSQMSSPTRCLMLTENDTLQPAYKNSTPGWMEKLPQGMAHGDYRLGVYWDGHIQKLDVDLNPK